MYLTYVHPYILAHELDIENLISSSHDQLKRMGMTYLRRLWAYLQQLLGVDPSAQSHAPPRPLTPQNQPQSCAQALLAKFSLPPIGPFDPQSALSALLSTFIRICKSPSRKKPQFVRCRECALAMFEYPAIGLNPLIDPERGSACAREITCR